ncbi:MAG: SMC-Scp complex subunit ScpB [Candidatus Aenigmarchaeota archaeon]|nr:SMC-Scp complex subunit ScpB [Candidatus Aenigmarchaeota archaeon]
MDEKKALLEAALFISDKPLSINELKKITGLRKREIISLLKSIEEDTKKEHRGIELFSVGESYHLRVKEKYVQKVSHLTPYADLSRAMLKVLSLAVYKEGITQSEVVKTIGNRAYDYIKDLVSMGLIKTEKSGRTKKLVLTQEFMKYFGISSRQELLDKFKIKTGRKELKDVYMSDFSAFFERLEKKRRE